MPSAAAVAVPGSWRASPSGAVALARAELAAEFLVGLATSTASSARPTRSSPLRSGPRAPPLPASSAPDPSWPGPLSVISGMCPGFLTPDHFAACTGTAPVQVSSGNRKARRLSLRGTRRINHAIHMAAITHLAASTAPAARTTTKDRRGKTRKGRCGPSRGGSATHLRAPPGRCELCQGCWAVSRLLIMQRLLRSGIR